MCVAGVGTPQAAVRSVRNPYMQWRAARVGVCLAL